MTISLIIAWAAALFGLLAAFKYVARVSGSRSLNRFFHGIHIPFGAAMCSAGLLHGLLAGNRSTAALSELKLAPVLFTPNWGSVCFLLSVFLGLTYLLRRRLKKLWMPLHRLGTAVLLVCLALHLLNVGIQLPGRILAGLDGAPAESAGPASEPASPQETLPGVDFSGAYLRDGIYTGSADGYNGPITVSVSVSDGAVTEVAVVSQSDSPKYFSRAESLLTDVVDSQSLKLDAVSGATYSSAGLINAIYDALQGAVMAGSLDASSIPVALPAVHSR